MPTRFRRVEPFKRAFLDIIFGVRLYTAMTDMSEIWKSTLRPALREQWHKLAHAVGPKLAAWCDHQVKFPDGMVFDTPPGMNNPDFLAMLMGRYEAAERSVLRRHFKAADTIIEIGANIGVVTHSVIRDKLQPHGRMICVEPNPDVIPSLASNIERSLMRFASEADVSLVQAALSAPRAAGDIANFNARSGLCSGLTSHLARRPTGWADGRGRDGVVEFAAV